MPDDFFLPFGGKLNKNNRWVKLAAIIPWWEFEDRYAACFKSFGKGEKAYTMRVALGSLLIQTKLGMPDREIVNLFDMMFSWYKMFKWSFDDV
jgi:transposase, IS5 family